MLKRFIAVALCSISLDNIAQIQLRETLDARATQIWTNKPAKITPGVADAAAPSDAIVLFDGKDLSQWTTGAGEIPKWEVKGGIMTVVKSGGNIKTKLLFGDVQLHVEWRTPSTVIGESQDRGNSGVFLQERYEVQVLDSYENDTYSNGQAGAIYKQSIPIVNACRKPGEWQSYDIIYTAPRFNDNGVAIIPAFITVMQNGVLIQNHFQILGKTEDHGMPVYALHGKASLMLQDHGNPVSYRNIWIREL
jgi:hypothetical protein